VRNEWNAQVSHETRFTDSAHPKKCVKGPDVRSKSIRTRRRYKDLLKDQRTLSSLGFTREKTHRKESDQVNKLDR
jgi:hypothetical protein